MKLFQYWDTGRPPDDVAELVQGLARDNPKLEHRLHDRASARKMIGDRLGERWCKAFDACAVPAMQADYFRLCALWLFGGVYIDADNISVSPLDTLVVDAPDALMVSLDGYLTTGFMMFRSPRNTFLRATLDVATDNIERRVFDNVYVATGPPVADAVRALIDQTWFEHVYDRSDDWTRGMRFGRLLDQARTLVRITPEIVAAYRAIRIMTVEDLAAWIGTKRPAYKSTERDWRLWRGSIYAEAEVPGS